MTNIISFPLYREAEELLTEHGLKEKIQDMELKKDITESVESVTNFV